MTFNCTCTRTTLVTSDPDIILTTWENISRTLAGPWKNSFQSCLAQVDQILVKSLENEETLLDVPFCSKEIEGALRKLKSGKSAGHDLLQPEHLKHGGEVLKIGSNKSGTQLWNLKCD